LHHSTDNIQFLISLYILQQFQDNWR